MLTFKKGERVVLFQGGTVSNSYVGWVGTVLEHNSSVVIIQCLFGHLYRDLYIFQENVRLLEPRSIISHMPSWF